MNVIALVSGGKDSFFSALHCLANGHRVVALANLHPGPAPGPEPGLSHGTAALPPPASAAVSGVLASSRVRGDDEQYELDQDLNSFMYQTVGHQVIPLYADATGLPLYRQPIVGGAGRHAKDYSHLAGADPDETESMVPLLRAVMAAHPEANAISAGAILSTYQRTRVESVATRLGLVPLAYLWKFPVLPGPAGSVAGDIQLLDDMAAAGMDARIIKVASGGLDDSFLWTNVASVKGRQRLMNAMRRFGAHETGAVIGEGGEFETLVLDGPSALFKQRIVVAEEDQAIIREGGGSSWLKLRNARLEAKNTTGTTVDVRIPDLLDADFRHVLDMLEKQPEDSESLEEDEVNDTGVQGDSVTYSTALNQWCFLGHGPSVEEQTASIVAEVRQRLQQCSLTPSAIISSTILLRRMADFPTINTVYGSLFDAPNPPSRVTVSCGDQLPAGVDVAVYLSVHNNLGPDDRQGLHVQSRSYWAPANIGPYSQAVSIPVSSLCTTGGNENTRSGLRLVTIAGQIPLVPATMALPSPDQGGLEMQIVLALQHLWRIGVEMGVEWWSSAVAYFPESLAGGLSMEAKAILAARAWEAAHVVTLPVEGEEGEDDEDGPDLWDRTFDARYRTLGEEGTGPKKVPDWDVVGPRRVVPAVFAAEVDELPRAAGVEWHAHVGFAGVDNGRVEVRRWVDGGREVYMTVVGAGEMSRFVQVIVAVGAGGDKGPAETKGEVDGIAAAALARLAGREVEVVPTVRYLVGGAWDESWGPVVPCKSLWDRKGRALESVAVYQMCLGSAGSLV
ncbi:hypothetical protein QBC47DRAFT_376704 [Echria macrotheca]|uniref:Diphthine--ammonia ligase n=1 Tax=Echria macrotheca TaxID=438768 RepID=A0AAJ0BG95_9PEZI|nr:hypothetical protein QBC47DRAFT_376704 [Echria macrotheca]